MSKCQRIRHLIGPYLYDDVNAKERAAVESHLPRCAACCAEVEALRELLSAIPRDTMQADPAAKARAIYAVQNRIAQEGVQRRRWRRWRETVLAAALAASAGLIFNLWTTYRPPQIVSPPAPAGREDVASKPPSLATAAGNLSATRRSPQAKPSPPHRVGHRTNGRRVSTPTVAQAADGTHGSGTGAPPPTPSVEPVTSTPVPSHGKSGGTPVKRQAAPPALVEVALVVPAPVAAPAVTGVDDVTQALVAPE